MNKPPNVPTVNVPLSLQIVIEGVAGYSYTGDIAIDDIYFTKGSCHGEKFAFQNDSKDTGGEV